MMTEAQQERILQAAYLPEHMVHYVSAISGAEPCCFGDYLVYAAEERLIFIGYPLGQKAVPEALGESLAEALRVCPRRWVSLIAPAIPPALGKGLSPQDDYYRLDLREVIRSPKTANMLRRAAQEASVALGPSFGAEHRQLVAAFGEGRPLDAGTRFIFAGIDRYLAAAPAARLIEARDREGQLIGFAIADFTAREYGFYMFNITDPKQRLPGLSDLLLDQMIAAALAAGKRYLNLGLGINAGIAAFKRKWGGVPFLPYAAHQYRPGGRGFLQMLFEGMSGRC